MELPDPKDQLVDRMLAELLSGERPPDLSGAILRRAAQAEASRQGRRRWLRAGIAAAILIVLAGAWFLSMRYPAPAGSGSLVVAGGGAIGRGAVVSSTGEGRLDLGGYAHLSMAPASRLTIEGEPRAESIYLQAGELVSEVDSKHGSFSVRTDDGIVRVTGTRFLVAVWPTDKGERMATRSTFVKVLAGTVIVSGAWGTQTLQAGTEMTMPPAQTLADKPAAPAEQSGTVVGKVTEKGEGWIRVKPAEGESERYQARWIGGNPANGGGLDKDMVAKIKAVKVGAKVEVKWTFEERKRVVGLTVLEEAK